jgi:hypothetical protein
MIVTALDHTREDFSAKFQPEDLAHTTAAPFFTRPGRGICQLQRFLWTYLRAAVRMTSSNCASWCRTPAASAAPGADLR